MTYRERQKIEKMYNDGMSAKEISALLSKHISTIYRELRNGGTRKMDTTGREGYSAELGQKNAYEVWQRNRGLEV